MTKRQMIKESVKDYIEKTGIRITSKKTEENEVFIETDKGEKLKLVVSFLGYSVFDKNRKLKDAYLKTGKQYIALRKVKKVSGIIAIVGMAAGLATSWIGNITTKNDYIDITPPPGMTAALSPEEEELLQGYKVYKTTGEDPVNVRTGVSTESEKVATLPIGTVIIASENSVEGEDSHGKRRQIFSKDGIKYFVVDEYLEEKGNFEDAMFMCNNNLVKANANYGISKVVNTDGVNLKVRRGPGTEHEVLRSNT